MMATASKKKLLEIDFNFVEFDSLCKEVQNCKLCPRMKGSQRVLNYSAGNLEAKIMFIGEAPGRLGADESGIPFHGDKAGNNFEELLHHANINREEIFVTNSALCNPKDESGNNSTPNEKEIINCSSFLKRQIELINPRLVVTLGGTALEATRIVSNHSLSLKNSVRTANSWFNRLLIPLYHPGQRAMMHRSFANQRSDYQFVSEQLRRLETPRRQYDVLPTQTDAAVIVEYILSKVSPLSYFALHKLFYLIEFNSFKKTGHRLTNTYIIRQKDGAYCTELHLSKLKKSIQGLNYSFKGKHIILYKNSQTLFQGSLLNEFDIDDDAKDVIDKVLFEHGKKSNAALKRTVYFSRPMRNILLLEKEMKINLYNSPIIFSSKDNL
jgi:uracil-DNA glycosylase family 4